MAGTVGPWRTVTWNPCSRPRFCCLLSKAWLPIFFLISKTENVDCPSTLGFLVLHLAYDRNVKLPGYPLLIPQEVIADRGHENERALGSSIMTLLRFVGGTIRTKCFSKTVLFSINISFGGSPDNSPRFAKLSCSQRTGSWVCRW